MRTGLLPKNKQNSSSIEVRTLGWDNWRIPDFDGENFPGLSARVVGVTLHLRAKTNFTKSWDPSSGSGQNTWSRSYELLKDQKSPSVGVVSVSETRRTLDFGVGVLTSTKGLGGSFLSSKGRGTILLHQIWYFDHLWSCSKIRRPPAFKTTPPKYLEHFEVLTPTRLGILALFLGTVGKQWVMDTTKLQKMVALLQFLIHKSSLNLNKKWGSPPIVNWAPSKANRRWIRKKMSWWFPF